MGFSQNLSKLRFIVLRLRSKLVNQGLETPEDVLVSFGRSFQKHPYVKKIEFVILALTLTSVRKYKILG